MVKPHGDWLEAIAARAKVGIARVEAVLATHGIVPAPVPGTPRRLMLLEISFSGVKDGVIDGGPFEFQWTGLGPGLWGMLTDQNLRGKTSILEVVRWLIRGRPSSNLQDDVRRWIHKARLRFSLDAIAHEVSLETKDGIKGNLICLGPDASVAVLASFATEREFEAIMADFFLRAFNMDMLTTWRDSGESEESGQAVTHGWASFSGAMFIGTSYEVLLGDLPVAAGVNPRLMQMYLGVPWVSTLAVAKTAQQSVQKTAEFKMRRSRHAATAREARTAQITDQLQARRHELSRLPSDRHLREQLSSLTKDYAEMKRREQAFQQRIERDFSARTQVEAAYQENRRDLQAHLDSMAAGAVFRMLDPTYCPRCDHSISESRKKQEKATHACAVCGESIATSEDAEVLRAELEERVKASKTAYDKATISLQAAEHALIEAQNAVAAIQDELEETTSRLGTFSRRQELLTAIATLEGRLEEATFEAAPEDEVEADELPILNAIVDETDALVKEHREDLLKDVSSRLVEFARRFGMHSLSGASLKGNATLSLTKGGGATSYSKVTDGEKLRLKVATVLAMIEVAEKRKVGRHPGLLMIDSPGAQEVSPDDLDQLVAGLESVSATIPHIQVFVSSRTSAAITEHILAERRREALHGGFLW